MRRLLLASVGVLCAVLVAAALYYLFANSAAPQGGQPMLPTKTITITTDAGPVAIAAEVATTVAEETQGLSGRAGLKEGSGMLFLFDPPRVIGFWMKDMRFSLDIVYADQDGTIATIYPELSPATYPQSFKPTVPVRYVLELPAGFVAAHNIAVGQKLVIQ